MLKSNYQIHTSGGGLITNTGGDKLGTVTSGNKTYDGYARGIFNCPTCKDAVYMEYRFGYMTSCCGVEYKGLK
ncbi:hypothetical protein ACO1DB_27660 [Bacillus cereus]|uniref:hypothetical protein n=1 Tax=Bacillus cereus TaxID=1396 RepID=UPI00047440F3|nr:hypothetical protein [Bacillus sp. BAU-SS-2023]